MPLIASGAPPSRAVEMNFAVPGTPEQVWAAVATGRGIGAWFVATAVEERVGGEIVFHLGPGMGDSAGQVTRWEPPHRFGYVEPAWCPGAPPIETEIEVLPASDGRSCTFRMIHKLNTADPQWDSLLVNMEHGWDSYIPVLRIYLAHHAGEAASAFRLLAPRSGSLANAWQPLQDAWGLADAKAGDPVAVTLDSGLRVEGTLERVNVGRVPSISDVMVRVTQPVTGVVQLFAFEWSGQVQAGLSVVYYGDAAAAARERDEQRWRAWFESTEPAD